MHRRWLQEKQWADTWDTPQMEQFSERETCHEYRCTDDDGILTTGNILILLSEASLS